MEGTRFLCDGLPVGDVVISEIRDEVSESIIVSYFGKKSSKSGWKYNVLPTLVEQEAILELYCRVYGTNDISNKEITASFAKGLILMSMGHSVNWSQFSEERRKIREGLKRKAEVRKEKREREDNDLTPSIVGKKRFIADRLIGSVFPSTLSLSVKSGGESDLRLAMGKKSSNSKVSRHGVLPCWDSVEVESIGEAIECNERLLQECRLSSEESGAELISAENSLRRAKLLLSDREMMADESKIKSSRFIELEQASRVILESRNLRIVELELRNDPTSYEERRSLQQEVQSLKGELEALAVKNGLELTTIRLSGEAIASCEGDIRNLQAVFAKCSERKNMMVSRVVSLESIIVSMREQVCRMQAGVGASFFPVPLKVSPQFPSTSIHTLNACPVCSLWYTCWDYLSLACGHTYHPYCLYEHSQRSDHCLVPDCKSLFDPQSKSAIGIRSATMKETVKNPIVSIVGRDQVVASASISLGTGSERSLTPTSSSEVGNAPEKSILPSQSSGTTTTPRRQVSLPVVQKLVETTNICEVCKQKPVAVFIKPCRHDFCFQCVQGLSQCPICEEEISGWSRINLLSKPNPFLSKAVVVSAPKSPLSVVVSPSTSKQGADMLVGKEAQQDPEDVHYSSSDNRTGVRTWSSSDVFAQGGARSGQDIVVLGNEMEPEEDCIQGGDQSGQDVVVSCDRIQPEEDSILMTAKSKRQQRRWAAVSQLLESEEQLDVQESGEAQFPGKRPRSQNVPARVYSARKSTGKAPVEKYRHVLEVSSAEERGTCEKVNGVSLKKSVGRPLGKSKLAAPALKVSCVAIEPSNMRVALRRPRVEGGVPVKFKGLSSVA